MVRDYSYFPLTFPQKNIYKTEITYPGTAIGVISSTLKIEDDNLNVEYIQQALNLVIKNNEAMRCRIKIIDREPRQYFVDYKPEVFEYFDYIGKPIQMLYDYDREHTKTLFELIDSPLYFFSLIRLSETECAIFAKVHHLINDAWGIVRVGDLVLEYYDKLSNGIEIGEEEAPPYTDYISDELNYLSSDRLMVDKSFWDTKLESYPNSTALKQRKSKVTNFKSKRKTFMLPEKLTGQLRQYCKDTHTSLFAVILSAFAIYIKRTLQKSNMVIGTPVLNRSSRRQKKTLGMFISTVPLFIDLEEDDNFIEFNKKLTREWMAVLKHQRYPFEFMLKEARERYKDIKDLFDVVFSYQNASFTKNENSARHKARWHFNECQLEGLSIHINDREGDGILVIDYDFLEDLFYEKEIDYIHDNFIRVLWHALDNPQRPMSELELVSEDEKQRILHEFNSSKADYPKDMTINALIERQAEKTPDAKALIYEDSEVTYARLDEMANSLANTLIEKGIKKEDTACIMMDKSIEMMVAILAVLKAGGAYLAIEKDLPAERKQFFAEDSGAKFFITERQCPESEAFKGEAIFTDGRDFSENTRQPEASADPGSLAYIMYTSGTTGHPKGVMIEHKSVVNYVYAFLNEFEYDGSEIVLEQCSYSFDAFVEEVFPTLAAGATLVISDKYGAKDMRKLADQIRRHKVSVVSVTPLVLNELNKMNDFDSVKTYISGGDVIKYEYYSNLIKNAKVYNTYGPTEATVCATYHRCDARIKESIPIGKPIANYDVYILDTNLKLLPIGVPGELYISGPGLARGYLNMPELTDEVFIDNPFKPGEKMYKTKDIARWYPMGEIDYIGRADRQVKIRGMRIELGEIESALISMENIKAAVVADKVIGDGKKKLCVYYETENYVSVKQIREYLRSRLPSHMVPSYFLEMDRIPLSSSGKVNLNALPDVDKMILNEETEYVPPANDIERRLVDLVEKLLKVTKVGTNDNYFELGGDSLDLTAFAYDIADEFNVDIPLEKLFTAKTMKEIADFISMASAKTEGSTQEAGNIFLMHRGEAGRDIFFIHDGIGGIGAYFELCHLLKEYNIWGIRSDVPESIGPKNIDVEETARRYAAQIAGISGGPYNIAGWCIGGTIAFEVAVQLRDMGKSINTLFLMDTMAPKRWYNEERFTLESEKNFIVNNLNYDRKSIAIENSRTLEELWFNVVEEIEKSLKRDEIIDNFVSRIPDDIVNYLDEYHESPVKDIFSFINLVRTFHIARAFYFPAKKIDTDICFIQAGKNSVAENGMDWGGYTSGSLKHIQVEGDHYTMLGSAGADMTARNMLETIASGK